MRFRMSRAIATLSVMLSASAASAVTVSAFANLPVESSVFVPIEYHFSVQTTVHPIGDKLTVELFLDADQTGIALLGLGVRFDDGILQYNPKLNASVGVPSYVLYGTSGTDASALYPQQDPWALWPGTTPPGTKQVNVNWADPMLQGTFVTGFGIKIAELEFEVIGDGVGKIQVVDLFPFQSIPLHINLVPEPTTAVLVGLGLVGFALATKRRAPRR
jgi:hypothetical protein